jgi:hypothetical protein
LQAVGVLRNLSVKMENKLTVVQEGALPPLVRLLESPEEEVQLQVSVVLRNLAVNASNKVKMVQAGVLSPLLKLLRSPNVRVQEQACACVQNLSVNNDNKLKLIEEGGIRALVSLLTVQARPAYLPCACHGISRCVRLASSVHEPRLSLRTRALRSWPRMVVRESSRGPRAQREDLCALTVSAVCACVCAGSSTAGARLRIAAQPIGGRRGA